MLEPAPSGPGHGRVAEPLESDDQDMQAERVLGQLFHAGSQRDEQRDEPDPVRSDRTGRVPRAGRRRIRECIARGGLRRGGDMG